MRRTRLKKKHVPIDKSQLAIGTPERVKDRKFLDEYKGKVCEVCGSVGTTIPAHVRAGHEGGMGLKPSDELTVGLCHPCHMKQEANPGLFWWVDNLPDRWWCDNVPYEYLFDGIKLGLKERYRAWKNG